MTTDTDVAEVLQLESELQTAECRRDRARVSTLLAEDFIEVGASGRVWDRPSTLDLLGVESEDNATIEVLNLTGRGPDLRKPVSRVSADVGVLFARSAA